MCGGTTTGIPAALSRRWRAHSSTFEQGAKRMLDTLDQVPTGHDWNLPSLPVPHPHASAYYGI